eukprot:gnl/TRDRNA2_/TRDRNA2_180377_c0_seq1.p1 gnl/TRDRNA2_/TRDRNA2_180377_c0~~gnl/TRDRNA2_/TRDRNA2_180377_c0_seq1.p1  ORF type:complete len:168 (-),score=66.95 gnl/TRDRNA2_/TRDRNA2_180377_c0_seq1:244-747(-)
MEEFKDSTTSLVADVDCTAGGKSLCETHGVKGYPTLKWGDPSDLQDYSGARDLASMSKFAKENLGPPCSPDNLDICDDESKAVISKFQKMDIDELDTKIEEADAKIKKMEADLKKKTDKIEGDLQELSKKLEKEKEKGENKVKAEKKKLGFKFMKAVHSSKKKKEEL